MADGKQVGYIRVSSADQNTLRQLDGVQLDRTFTDYCSGKDTKRPQLVQLLDYVREGDTIYVHSMDRLARNLIDLLAMVKGLTGKGVTLVFVKNGMTFAGSPSPTDKLMLAMLGAVAEFERDMIRERQAEGIALAKAKGGVYKGRQPNLDAAGIERLRAAVATGKPKAAVARDFAISRASLYAYLKQPQPPASVA